MPHICIKKAIAYYDTDKSQNKTGYQRKQKSTNTKYKEASQKDIKNILLEALPLKPNDGVYLCRCLCEAFVQAGDKWRYAFTPTQIHTHANASGRTNGQTAGRTQNKPASALSVTNRITMQRQQYQWRQ